MRMAFHGGNYSGNITAIIPISDKFVNGFSSPQFQILGNHKIMRNCDSI